MTKKPLIDNQPRRKPTRKRGEATVAFIVMATERVLERDGIKTLNTTKVAKVCGVSVGSIYRFFPNKESLIAAVVEKNSAERLEIAAQVVHKQSGVPLEKVISDIIEALSEYCAKRPEFHRIIAREILRIAREEEISQIEMKAVALVRQLFENHRSQLTVPDLDLAAFVVMYTVENMFRTILMQKPAEIGNPKFKRELIRLVCCYLFGKTR